MIRTKALILLITLLSFMATPVVLNAQGKCFKYTISNSIQEEEEENHARYGFSISEYIIQDTFIPKFTFQNNQTENISNEAIDKCNNGYKQMFLPPPESFNIL